MGVPTEVGAAHVLITAKDKAGATAENQFVIHVADNSAPVVVKANAGATVPLGSHFDYDATKGGTVFSDPDGDELTYQVSLRGQTDHVVISGTHVTGEIDTAGIVEVTVTASDGYGGSTSNVFVIAAPGQAPVGDQHRAPLFGSPSSPLTLNYRDEKTRYPNSELHCRDRRPRLYRRGR